MTAQDDTGGSALGVERTRREWINRDFLKPFASKALKTDIDQVLNWDHEIIKGSWVPPDSLVCRLSGFARKGRADLTWSLILKVPPPTSAARDPLNREPFQRELLVMQCGILEQMPDCIAGPRLLGISDMPDDEPWVWMEDVQGDSSFDWPLPRFRLCAHHMGLMKGWFLEENTIDSRLDLSARLAQEIDVFTKQTDPFYDAFPVHPMTRQLSKNGFGERIRRLREKRGVIIDALLRLPLTFSHGDFCYPNLFSRVLQDGRDQTVLVDWQYAGYRQIGSDLGPFVSDCTMHPRFRKAAEPREFLELIVDGFQSGLKESGWPGDLRITRFCILARLAAIAGSHRLAALWHKVLQHSVTKKNRAQLEADTEQFIRDYEFFLDSGEEAGKLLKTLPLGKMG